MSEVIAVIPARGGSKGIPGKNVIAVAGVPLVAHSVRHAVEAVSVDRVFVSTDDPHIAEVSAANGAEIIERPPELGTDVATSESALAHALAHYGELGHPDPDLIVFLQATSPLRRPDDIDRAVDQLRRGGADSLLSAQRLHTFVWQKKGEELTSLTYDYRHRQRRQDLDNVEWLENGSIYVFRPWVLRQLGNRLGGRIEIFEMDAITSFQVDEPADLALIERLAPAVSTLQTVDATPTLIPAGSNAAHRAASAVVDLREQG